MSGDRDDELREERRPDVNGAMTPDDEGIDALRALLGPRGDDGGQLAMPDHEALLAMTLGEDVAAHEEGELAEAEALRRVLDGGSAFEAEGPVAGLAELAEVLRVTARATAEVDAADHEALLALALGSEASVSSNEREAASQLAERLDSESFVTSLRAAHEAAEIDAHDDQILLALAMESVGEVTSSWSAATRASAAALAADLDGEGDGDAALLPWTQVVRAAAGQLPEIDQLSHERRLRASLAGETTTGGGGEIETVPRRAPLWLGAVIAAAAAIALFIGFGSGLDDGPPRAGMPGPVADQAAATLKPPRSTADLFDPVEAFGAKGGESGRVDKILTARAADLRNNRFAAWGVR